MIPAPDRPPERLMLLKETALVRLLSLKIPVLLFVAPRVKRLDDEVCEIVVPLGWRTRNHLGSMYFGALCVGADLAGGLHAARLTTFGPYRSVKLVFADVRGEFLKRADGDVLFRCADGARVAAAVRETHERGERVTLPVEIAAFVPERYGDEAVARFTLALSLKRATGAPMRVVETPPTRGSAAGA
jgi:acyl-coenzyme A thioesterase PaaI-like protein